MRNSTSGTARRSVSPSTEMRQWRARAPSMNARPRSSATERFAGVSASFDDGTSRSRFSTFASGAGIQPVPGAPLPRLAVGPHRADLADQQVRRGEPRPAEVAAVPDAVDGDLPDARVVDGAVELQGEPGRRPGGEAAVARRWLRRSDPSGRSGTRSRTGSPRASSFTIATVLNREPVDEHHHDREPGPEHEAPAAQRGAAEATAGETEAGEQRGGEQRDEPRVGRLERRQQRLRARGPRAGSTRPAIEGTGAASPRARARRSPRTPGPRARRAATPRPRPRSGSDRRPRCPPARRPGPPGR